MRIFSMMSRAAAALLFCLAALCPAVSAQTSTGGVNGTVTDPNGAAVPGSTVTLVNKATNIEKQAATNESGYFTFVNVNPGTYSLRVEARGFSTAQTPPFDVGVNQTVPQNITLAVGSVSQTVEVVAAGEMLQSSSSELGTVIPKEAVEDLPLNGRNFTQLLSLTPGATPVNTAQGGGVTFQDAGPTGIPGTTIVKPSLHGQQNRSTLYFQDGFINTDLRGPIYGIPPIVDVIQEFKVQGHNDKAEYGGVTGGIVNVVSRSGGNDYHGSAYEFVRNDAFDARNPFSDAARTSPAPFRQNQYGGTFGGHIIKNKTFFFAGYEGWRYSKPTGDQAYVPTAAELNGDFTNSPLKNQIFNPYSTRRNPANQNQFIRDPFKCDASGNPVAPLADGTQPTGTACLKIPSQLINPAMQGLLKAYLAQPNFNGGASINYVENRPSTDRADSWQVRIDHTFSKKDNVFFRWSQIYGFHLDQIPGTLGDRPSNYHGNNYGGGWIHTFNSRVMLDVRAGILQKPYDFNQARSSVGTDTLTQLGFANVDKFGGVDINLGSPWQIVLPSSSNYDIGSRGDSIRRNPDWSASANLTWIKGNHSFSGGYQYIYVARDQINSFQLFGFSGATTNNPLSTGNTGLVLASALLGFPTSASGELPAGGEVHFRLSTWSLYFQDEWKVKPKLTLNYGLRWDVLPVPHVIGPRLANALDLFNQEWIIGAAPGSIPACNQVNTNPCFPGNGLSSVPFSDHIVFSGQKAFHPPAIWDNFGPRVGVAYQWNQKTVIRAGYGLYFDALPARSQYAQNDLEAAQWPWVRSFSSSPNSGAGAGSSGQPLVPITAIAGNLTAGPPSSPWNSLQSTFFDDPHYKDGWSQQFSVEVQRQLNSSTVFSVAYVGSVNGRLPYTGKANAARQASPQGTPATTVDALRAIPWMTSNLNYTQSIGSASYNALQTKLQRRLSKGLTTLISYTWSKSIDNSSGYFGVENGAGQNGSSVQSYFDPDSNRSVSGYDIPHFFSWYTLYEIPFGHDKRWFKEGAASWLLGGWQVNYIFQARTGQPFNLNVSGDPANISGSIGSVTGYARPNLIADPFTAGPVAANPDPLCQKTISQGGRAADAVFTATSWFNPCAFAAPTGSFGNFGRNVLRSANVYNVDMSLFKKIRIGEGKELQLRGEAFNVFNIMNLAVPSVTTIGQTGAGRITSIVGNPRQIQFGARFVF
jgi:hypothetical protein